MATDRRAQNYISDNTKVPASASETKKVASTFFEETFEPGFIGIEFRHNYGSRKVAVARFISEQDTGKQGQAIARGTISVGDILVAINDEIIDNLEIGEINCRLLAASDRKVSLRFQSYNANTFRASRLSTATEKVYYGDDLLLHRRLLCGLNCLVVYDSQSDQDICGVSVLFTAGSRGVRSEPARKQEKVGMFEKESSQFGSFKKWRTHQIPALDKYPREKLPPGSDTGCLHISCWEKDSPLVNMPAPSMRYDDGTSTQDSLLRSQDQDIWLDVFVYRSFLGQSVKLGFARLQVSPKGVPLNGKVDEKGNVVIEVHKTRTAERGSDDTGPSKDFIGLLVLNRITVQTINDVDLHVVYSLRRRRQLSFKGLANIILHVLDTIVTEANHYAGFMIQPFVSEIGTSANAEALFKSDLSSIEMLALVLYGELRADLSALLERNPAHAYQFGDNIAGAAPFALYAAFEEFHSRLACWMPRLLQHAVTVSVQSRQQMHTAPESVAATRRMLMGKHSRQGTLGSKHPLLLIHPSRDFGAYIYCWVNHKAKEFASKHLPLCFAKELWSVGTGFKRGQHSVSCDDLNHLLKSCTEVYSTLPGSTLPHNIIMYGWRTLCDSILSYVEWVAEQFFSHCRALRSVYSAVRRREKSGEEPYHALNDFAALSVAPANTHLVEHFSMWHVAKVTGVNMAEGSYNIEFVFGNSKEDLRKKTVPQALIRPLSVQNAGGKWKGTLSDETATWSLDQKDRSGNGFLDRTMPASKPSSVRHAVGDMVEVNVDRGNWSQYPAPEFYLATEDAADANGRQPLLLIQVETRLLTEMSVMLSNLDFWQETGLIARLSDLNQLSNVDLDWEDVVYGTVGGDEADEENLVRNVCDDDDNDDENNDAQENVKKEMEVIGRYNRLTNQHRLRYRSSASDDIGKSSGVSCTACEDVCIWKTMYA